MIQLFLKLPVDANLRYYEFVRYSSEFIYYTLCEERLSLIGQVEESPTWTAFQQRIIHHLSSYRNRIIVQKSIIILRL